MKYQIGTKLESRQNKQYTITGVEGKFYIIKDSKGVQRMRLEADVDKYYKVVNELAAAKSTNRVKIEKRCAKHNFRIGCYDNKLEQLSEYSLRKVLENIQYSTDVKISINRKPYIVEIDEVDNEVDFSVTALKEYESRFGKWED